MVVELRLVLDLHLVAGDLEVQVEVDPQQLVVALRGLEGRRGVHLVAAECSGVGPSAQNPPLPRHRDPQLIAVDDLDLAGARTLPTAASEDQPGCAVPGGRQPVRGVDRRDGSVPFAFHDPYGLPGCVGHEHRMTALVPRRNAIAGLDPPAHEVSVYGREATEGWAFSTAGIVRIEDVRPAGF